MCYLLQRLLNNANQIKKAVAVSDEKFQEIGEWGGSRRTLVLEGNAEKVRTNWWVAQMWFQAFLANRSCFRSNRSDARKLAKIL